MTMRRQVARQNPSSWPQVASESKIHGSMKRQREMGQRVLFFVLGAVFVLTWQTFCSVDRPAARDEPVQSIVRQGNVRASPARKVSLKSTTTRFSVDPSVQKIYNDIDNEDNKARCARYGWDYKPRDKPRRIFFGSLIADDSLDTLLIHATETYGIYDTVVFVESNLTQTQTVRPLRFAEGSERLEFIQSGIFGPSTSVHVDYFFNETLTAGNHTIRNPMARERIQRNLIVQRWKQSGMGPDDIGIVADIDETFSRDVLRAAQVCDIPQFRPDQDCHLPRLTGETLIFESSPECMQKGRRWIHPDMIIGECVDGIGDPTGHPVPGRQYFGLGMRNKGYGYKGPHDYYRMDNSTGRYPLWNIADIRELKGYEYIHWNETNEQSPPAAYASGFHFHNFFEELETLRNKYLTYAHPHADAMNVPLSMHEDIDLLVRCVKGLSNPNKTWGVQRFHGGFEDLPGPKPIFFQNETYRLLRHAAVRRMLIEDEKRHGSEYPRTEEDQEDKVMHW